MKRLTILMVMVAAVLFALVAFAGDKQQKIVVNDLKATGVNPDTAKTLGDVLCSHISNTHKNLAVVCSQDLKVILQSKNQMTLLGGCDDDKCLAEIGNLLQADYVLSGSMGAVGKKYVINLSILDVNKGMSLARATVDVDKDGDLLKAIKKAADKLFDSMKKAEKPKKK